MKRALLFIYLTAFCLCTTANSSPPETRFSRERATLTRFNGPTSEQSCGGTDLTVYLKDGQMRHLDWNIETSKQIIRRQYYFDGTTPRLVVETIHAKFDSHGELLREPHFLSAERYRLDTSRQNARQKELRDHANFLIDDFNKHRTEFSQATDRRG